MANVPPELEDKFERCKEKVMGQGNDESSAFGICYAAVVEGKADALAMAAKAGFELSESDKMDIALFWAGKFGAGFTAVKAVGDWELDITATPFNSRDSDGQWFDDKTDIMENAFNTPVVLYQHGIKQGAKGLQERPVVVGRTVPGSLIKKSDGWHMRVVLDQAKKLAKDIMDAAMKRMVAVSSDSILHLARLEVGGKFIQYEKNRPGRIAVWPLAGVSLWEKGGGNFQPANQLALALPAMKAIYRDAGLPFPDVDTHGVTNGVLVGKIERTEMRAGIEKIREESKRILKYINN